ncbi:Uncharacterised protein [Segatella copri]|nr:Uncharacterised protein [Segatella copri]
MMFVHVSASMSVLPPRLASLYCLVPIGMSMRILCVSASRLFSKI